MQITEKTRALFAQFLGRDPHPTGAGKNIFHIKAGDGSKYRFEWHPQRRRVYLIRMSNPTHGECIAFDIETHGDAINAVNIWGRGYQEGRTPDIVKPHLLDL